MPFDLPLVVNGSLLLATTSAGVWDLRTGRIPNQITYGAMVLGLILAGLRGGSALMSASLGLLVGFALFAVAFRLGLMGGGDVKLMGAIGALKGFPFVIYVMYYACAVTAVLAFAVLVYRGAGMQTLRDIGRFTMTGLLAGSWELPAPRIDLRIPFGAALALASQLTLLMEARLF